MVSTIEIQIEETAKRERERADLVKIAKLEGARIRLDKCWKEYGISPTEERTLALIAAVRAHTEAYYDYVD